MPEKPTTGPWARYDTEDYAEIHPASGKQQSAIALVGRAADANLIAATSEMYDALDRIFSYVSYVNIHGVGEQPEPREDGQPQPIRCTPEQFAEIFQDIGRLASAALSKAEGGAA